MNTEPKFDGRIAFSEPHRSRLAQAPRRRDFARRFLGVSALPLKLRDPLLLLTVFAALALVLTRRPFGMADAGLTLLALLLFLAVRQAPIARTREKSLTFLPPVALAVCLWCGVVPAALAALLTAYLAARFSDGKIPGRRKRLRMHGVHLALSVLAANGGFAAILFTFRIQPAALILWRLPLASVPALPLLVAASVAALVFAAVLLTLTAAAEPGTAQNRFFTGEMPVYLKHLALSLWLGLLPIVLLTPLAAAWGLAIAPSAAIVFLLAAQVVRLSVDIHGLRGQIETAEALGRASILEPEETDSARLLERFLALSQNLITSDRSLVWIMDQETGILTPVAGLPDMGLWRDEETVFGEGLIGHTAARLRPRLIRDAAKDAHRARREIASGAWLLYPVMAHERLLGVAQWIRPVGKPFTSEDIARLDALIPQAAVTLENVRIRQAMNHLAATDGLTNLWNHRKMHELLRVEMKRSTRYHRALSVLMLDVDSFKTFNDTYGHPQGDQLLRNIAGILRAGVRNVDFVGRYGGEEFLVILPETTKDDACRMAERIRSDVEEQAMLEIDGKIVRRTVSVGVASYPEDALNPADLVQRADEALYRAKRSGKNCVIWA